MEPHSCSIYPLDAMFDATGTPHAGKLDHSAYVSRHPSLRSTAGRVGDEDVKPRLTTGGVIAAAALSLALAAATPGSASAGTRAIGIDVSRFQGAIDWPSVAGAGVRFAFVQASRGSGVDCTVKPAQCGADPYFAANRAAAEASGIRVGAYHRAFASGGTDRRRASGRARRVGRIPRIGRHAAERRADPRAWTSRRRSPG